MDTTRPATRPVARVTRPPATTPRQAVWLMYETISAHNAGLITTAVWSRDLEALRRLIQAAR